MKTLTLLLSTLTVAVVLFAPSAHADSTPMETVQHTSTTVMNILNDQAFEESGDGPARVGHHVAHAR